MDDDEIATACIQHTHEKLKNTTWCGKPVLFEFCFTDIDHAIYNFQNQYRLNICRKCVHKVKSAFSKLNLSLEMYE